MKIKVNNVGFSYDGIREVFRGIDFELQSGEIVCILGPNGIGKTTLLSCMAKLRIPTEGTIQFDEQDLSQLSHREIAQMVGYVPQFIIPSFDYSVLDYVVTGLAPWLGTFEKPGEEHYRQAESSLRELELLHLKDKPYTRLSGGELQQISIARTITQQSKIILMDEPTAHLDYGNQLKVLRIIKELAEKKEIGIVLTTHNPDQVLLLKGKVAVFDRQSNFSFGHWKEVLTDDLLSSIYGVPMRMVDIVDVPRKVCIAPNL